MNELATARDLLDVSLARVAREVVEELSYYACRSRPTSTTSGYNDDQDVPSGEIPYETIDDDNRNILLGDDLGRTPWGTNAKDNHPENENPNKRHTDLTLMNNHNTIMGHHDTSTTKGEWYDA